jgi:hypothetical protein
MNEKRQVLCDAEGKALCVQLTYAEYVWLEASGIESAKLRTRQKQLVEILTSGGAMEALPVLSAAEPNNAHKPLSAPVPAMDPVVSVSAETRRSVHEEPVAITEAPPGKPLSVEPGTVRKVSAATPVVISPVLLAFLKEQDPSENAKKLIEACVAKLVGLYGKRITLSLHKPYICLWDFDEWVTFAYGEIIQGKFFLSIDRSVVPDAVIEDVWTPPKRLSEKELVRMKIETITDELIARLQCVLTGDLKTAKSTGVSA